MKQVSQNHSSSFAIKPRISKDDSAKSGSRLFPWNHTSVWVNIFIAEFILNTFFLLALRDDVQSTLLADEGDRQADQHVSQATFPTIDETER